MKDFRREGACAAHAAGTGINKKSISPNNWLSAPRNKAIPPRTPPRVYVAALLFGLGQDSSFFDFGMERKLGAQTLLEPSDAFSVRA